MTSSLELPRARWRLRSLLSVVLTLFISAAVISITVVEAFRQRTQFQDELEREGRLLVGVLNEVLADALYFDDVERARQLSELVRAVGEVERYRLFRVDGRLLVDSDAAKFPSGTMDQETLELVLGSVSPTVRRRDNLEVIGPIHAGNQVLGGVVVALDQHAFSEEIRQMVLSHLQWGLLAMVLGVVFAQVLARWLIGPVRQLTLAAERVASGDLNFSAGAQRHDEIGDLSSVFEQMVLRLEQRAQHQAKAYTEQLELANDLLHRHAMEDALTGLPNRRLLLDRLAMAIAEAKRRKDRVGILFLDLDNFKLVNDSLGHVVGDEILREVAERLQQATRDCDTVARLGGDEFTVVATDLASPEHAIRMAEKVKETLRTPFLKGNRRLELTASVGVSVYPDDGEDPKALLENADIAMYRAKELGRDSIQPYARQMGKLARQRLNLERGLLEAISTGQLTSYYQPIHDVASGRICAVESLLRWEHPDRGVLSAREFIPLLEQVGRLDVLDHEALSAGAVQVAVWNERFGVDLRLAVNLSARHFTRVDVVAEVREILDESGLDPMFLEVEITETEAMNDDLTKMATLKALDSLGVSISIDDFGTGYSSLSYLRSLPIRRLKIDQQFVRELPHGQESSEIVKAMVSLAHRLGIRVTAEGIETKEQLAYLASIGCDEAQGHWFEPALPPAEVEAILCRSAVEPRLDTDSST